MPNGKSVLGTLLTLSVIAALPVVGQAQTPPTPITPIQHVIVIFGENRSFDHVFGTYVPRDGQTVHNLLSEGIVDVNGAPGPNYEKAHQYSATDSTFYSIDPGGKTLYQYLPTPLTGGANTVGSDPYGEPFATLKVALKAEPNLPPSYRNFLITGATGLPTACWMSFSTRLRSLRSGHGRGTPEPILRTATCASGQSAPVLL
ncbi:MAG: alkaline phosphatase family protein [Candidatus Sulfotelmatobacter sp.]